MLLLYLSVMHAAAITFLLRVLYSLAARLPQPLSQVLSTSIIQYDVPVIPAPLLHADLAHLSAECKQLMKLSK